MYACINQMGQKANKEGQYLITVNDSPIFLRTLQYIIISFKGNRQTWVHYSSLSFWWILHWISASPVL